MAARKGRYNLCSFLLQNGANMEMRNKVNFLFQFAILLCVMILLILMGSSRGIVCLSTMLAVYFKYSSFGINN